MRSRAEEYRRRGIEAQKRAAQTTEPKIKDAFEDVASGWFELAEQMDWWTGDTTAAKGTKDGKA